MPRQTTTYKCLIISPSDVEDERDAVEKVLLDWNAHAGDKVGIRAESVRWESQARPELGQPAQAIINQQLVDDCDFGIAIFWSRIGSPTAGHASGSVEEIERLLDRKCKVMVYFCARDIPQNRLVDDQFRRLQEVKHYYQARGLLASYRSIEQLREQIVLHVNNLLAQLNSLNAVSKLSSADSDKLTAPKPDIRVRPIWRTASADGLQWEVVEFRIENHSPNVVFIDSLELITDNLDVFIAPQDCITGEDFTSTTLEAGDRISFHLDPNYVTLRYPGCRVMSLVAIDKIGRTYAVNSGAIDAAKLDWLCATGQLSREE